MDMRISHCNIWVFDQDEALEFYVGKLGFVIGDDNDLGFMRWLTVHPAGQPDVQLILCDPTAVLPPDKLDLVKRVLAEGVGGGPLLATVDCRAMHAELSARGVEFTQELTETPYGVDCEVVDPFGNRIRLVQRVVVGAAATV